MVRYILQKEVSKELMIVFCLFQEEQDQDTTEVIAMTFLGNHGKNIQLSNGNQTARRVASYNQGILVSSKPLLRNQTFKVRY